MGRTIVIAYDRSADGKRALERGADLADSDTALSVINVTDREPTPGALKAQQEALAEADAIVGNRGSELRLVEAAGDAAELIIAEAREIGADLVVVGSRGESGLRAALMGSVSTQVVQRAPCDVLVVR